MEIKELYNIFKEYPNVSTDSRSREGNSLFFALKGASFNGNAYAYQALENGAIYAIIDDADYKHDDRYILVDDVLITLQRLANYHRKQLNIPVIGITGTNGKTTTKELVNAVLSEKYNVACTKGNLNNHIGVPLTLLTITNSHEISIVEMGANHVNEIAELCAIAEPTHGIITNVGKAHLEGFGSFENIIATKSELYQHLEKNNGVAFVNSQDDILRSVCNVKNKIFYSSDTVEYVWGTVDPKQFTATGILTINDTALNVKSQLFGEYNFKNILAAACIADYFNVDAELIKNAIENYTPSNNRSQLQNTERNTLIVDAYNANPTSMGLALENFINSNANKKAVVLGEMLELGDDSQKEHTQILQKALESEIEIIMLVGNWGSQNMCSDRVFIFECVEELQKWLKSHMLNGYHILIKGSRGIKLEQAIEVL